MRLTDEVSLDFTEVDLKELNGNAPEEIKKVWKSKLYLVRYYRYQDMERLSINYTVPELDENVDVIRWDILQSIKNTLGFAHRWAIEVFPPEEENLHSINQRHLWLVKEPDLQLADYERKREG